MIRTGPRLENASPPTTASASALQALFSINQGPGEGHDESLSQKTTAASPRPDLSAQEEHGSGPPAEEAMFSRPYALSSAHEEVVNAFASGQRRLAGQLARQQRGDPATSAEAEREAHLTILRDHFGRGFLRRAQKMLEDEETEEAAPLLGAPPPPAKQQQAQSPVVSVHATAWAALPPRPRSATHSFRLTAHTSTEDEEVDVDGVTI